MALNFPDNPTVGDIYTDNTSGFSYEWDGVVWKSYTPSATKNITILDDISGSFDGIETIFPLTVSAVSFTPANAQQLRIVLGGVIQEPGSDYTVSGTSLIFTTPPAGGLSFSGISLGPAVPVGVSTIGDVYNRNTYAPTGVQTTFTFTGGYTVGYLDVYQNGVRLSAGTDFTATDGTTFDLTVPANTPDELEAIGYKISTIVITEGQLTNLFVTNTAQVIGYTTLSNLNVTNNLNVAGIVTASSFVGNVTGNVIGNVTGTATGLSGGPDINVGNIVGSSVTFTNLTVNGTQTIINTTSLEISDKTIGIGSTSTPSDSLADGSGIIVYGDTNKTITYNNTKRAFETNVAWATTETRFINVSEKLVRIDGNTVDIAYNLNSANIGLCTNPSGNITLNVTGIPTDSSFDNHTVSFSLIINQTGTARSCTAVTLNGVSKYIHWAGGSLTAAISGVTTTNGYDIYSFTGINTVGSASTAANYVVFGSVSGGFR